MCKINSDDSLQYDWVWYEGEQKRKMINLKKKRYSLLISNKDEYRDNVDNKEYKSKYSVNGVLLLQ